MPKKVLILVLSSDSPPYDRLMQVQQQTWDSIEVGGCETVFYCAESSKKDTDKVIYLPIDAPLFSVTQKTYMALDWALKNKDFDYIARVHSSIYVNKKKLIKYVQDLPDTNVLAGLRVLAEQEWLWGGCGFVISKDVVEKLVENKSAWPFSEMEDRALSFAATKLGIPFTDGRGCSIDKMKDCWRCMMYGGGESFEFSAFSAITQATGQFHFRCKQDYDRTQDEYVMRQLFKYLQ